MSFIIVVKMRMTPFSRFLHSKQKSEVSLSFLKDSFVVRRNLGWQLIYHSSLKLQFYFLTVSKITAEKLAVSITVTI